ncbi:MAG: hypothetical protein QNJ00_00295 [Woeseiaceae bacterium]|nr:hypothetical protein [Woeseiaceae bacterium]
MITPLTLAVLAMIVVSTLFSLMVLFMGGGQSAPDLEGMMYVQAAAIPFAIAVIAFVTLLFVSAWGWRDGLGRLWQAMPQWLVFAFVLLNSLFIAGEMAMWIVARAYDEALDWRQQVPLVSLFLSSAAFLVLYARTRVGKTPVLSGRWAPDDDEHSWRKHGDLD